MKMIVGGSYQGKRAYACHRYGIKQAEIADGRSCDLDAVRTQKAIADFQEYIRRFYPVFDSYEAFFAYIMEQEDLTIITNEIGYGVVPLEAADREWREYTGRLCCMLAKSAQEVVRVVCGNGMVIKQ